MKTFLGLAESPAAIALEKRKEDAVEFAGDISTLGWVQVPLPRHFCVNTRTAEETVNFGLWLGRKSYRDSAVRSRVKILKQMMKGTAMYQITYKTLRC